MSDSSERPNTQDIEARSKVLFDASVEHLDGRTRSKLTQARTRALAEVERSRKRPQWLGSAPVTALAAAVVVAVTIGLWPSSERQVDTTVPFDDFDLVAGTESFEMLKDVEFYAWLDDVPEFGDHTG